MSQVIRNKPVETITKTTERPIFDADGKEKGKLKVTRLFTIEKEEKKAKKKPKE